MDWLSFIAAMTKALAWPLTVGVLVVAAIIVLREPISDLVGRIVTMKAGPVSVKTRPPNRDPEVVKQIQEIAAHLAAADTEHLDALRLVIRDTRNRPRIIIATGEPSGEPFLALIDENGEVRASLSASSAADPTGVAMLLFPAKGRPPADMAAFIGADSSDGGGAVGIRDSSGTWKEIS
jgi:hypothetical protein